MPNTYKALLGVLLFSVWLSPACGQSVTREHVYIDFNSGISIINNSFTDTWDPYPSVHLNLRFPFYTGQLEGGLRFIRFEGYAPSTTDSDFNSLFFHVGYSYPLPITTWWHIAPAIRIGSNVMSFDEAELFTNASGSERFTTDQSEIEFAYEVALRNQFSITNRLHLHMELSYNRTYTYFRLPLTLFSAGVTYSFPEPDWLKDFLR